VKQEEKPVKTNVIHAADEQQDVISMKEGNRRGSSPHELPTKPKTKRKQYRIKPEEMKKRETCIKHYNTAVQQKWIDDSSRNQLAWFSCWAKCCRLWKAERITNPAAYFVHVIKSELLHKFPAEQDETKAMSILKGCRREGLIAHR